MVGREQVVCGPHADAILLFNALLKAGGHAPCGQIIYEGGTATGIIRHPKLAHLHLAGVAELAKHQSARQVHLRHAYDGVRDVSTFTFALKPASKAGMETRRPPQPIKG